LRQTGSHEHGIAISKYIVPEMWRLIFHRNCHIKEQIHGEIKNNQIWFSMALRVLIVEMIMMVLYRAAISSTYSQGIIEIQSDLWGRKAGAVI
jgi:hypothetical protein